MNIKTLLAGLLHEFRGNLPQANQLISRDIIIPDIKNKINVLIGMRRVGKSSLLLQVILALLQENVPLNSILYLNFEDDRLLPCDQKLFASLIESFYQLFPENHQQKVYLFVDEIQNVAGWQQVIRRMFDTKQIKIYLSGSSAKLLSAEIATSLRGRSFATEIWPFDFTETLRIKNINYDKKELFGQSVRDNLLQQLEEYIQHGGFPEIFNTQPEFQRKLLQDYVELVVVRDIIERHNINNISLLKYLLKSLLKNCAGNFSINKFVNDAKSQGFQTTRNTIHDYLTYLEDAYLLFQVGIYSESIKKIQNNPKKNYAIDTGLANAFSFSLNRNLGHFFENLIFLDLKREGCNIYYYLTNERYEVDFLIEDRTGEKKLIQVCWDTSNAETLQREIRALETASKELNLPGELITPESYIENFWEKP